MFLETLENNDESIIVYSINSLSPDENFKIISKKDPLRSSSKVSSNMICELIKSNRPKNLIAYRVLTNLEDISVKDTEFGIPVKTNEGEELLYSDPVFAFQELENILEGKYNPLIKFRLQQVGLTTVSNNNAIFKELFHFDLNADEAQTQDDSVFIKTIFKQKTIVEEVLESNNQEFTEMQNNIDSKQKKKISKNNIFNLLNILKENIKIYFHSKKL